MAHRFCAGLQHLGDLVTHAVEDAVEVDADDPVPLVQVRLPGGCLLSADAGVVNRQVQGSVCVHRMADHHFRVSLAGRVLSNRRGRPSGFGDFLDDALRRAEVDVGYHHTGSLGSKLLADCFPDAGAAAGDKRYFPRELFQYCLLYWKSACQRSGPNTSYWISLAGTSLAMRLLLTDCRNGNARTDNTQRRSGARRRSRP